MALKLCIIWIPAGVYLAVDAGSGSPAFTHSGYCRESRNLGNRKTFTSKFLGMLGHNIFLELIIISATPRTQSLALKSMQPIQHHSC